MTATFIIVFVVVAGAMAMRKRNPR